VSKDETVNGAPPSKERKTVEFLRMVPQGLSTFLRRKTEKPDTYNLAFLGGD